jgi:UDP-N-acetylglucosamine 2-epimerase (non-hydrolysing)
MKVLVVFGTRPEAIKLAPVIQELHRYPDQIQVNIGVTAQHRQMLDQVLNLFHLKPDFDLNLMESNQRPIQVMVRILEKLDDIFRADPPDWVLVQGDTTTVMAAALAASYAEIKIGHVEAGLRTYDKKRPFPEEINRRVTGVIADKHFAPTPACRENLLRERIPPDTIHVTGNTVIDAVQAVAQMPYHGTDLQGVDFSKRLILVTAHRRENFGAPLLDICHALAEIAHAYRDSVQIVYPVHLNPNVQQTVYGCLGEIPNIVLLPPLDYLPLVHLMKNSAFILTDSGGIQEEAPGLGKPVLVMRDVTERPEAIESGNAQLVGTDQAKIIQWAGRLLTDETRYRRMAQAANPFGDGRAAQRIVRLLLGLPTDEFA